MTIESFEQIESFSVDFAPVQITRWRSKRTGLQICYIDQPSPIVQGFFAVATEIPDDSGAPHTLEHLVFMGSKKYPYKGFLDTLGNRLFSSTNAWTAVDQTVYNITTAGWEGFKTILPIYLDHILHPTLTDEACLTEVYHIDEKGDEKGVVFCEMQGYETQPSFQVFTRMQRLLYNKDSGYSSETGGLMAELRKLTNEKIRAFHSLLYRPDNLCVIITGSIDETEMLEIMTKFDSEIAPLPERPNKRPWVDSVHDEPLKETIIDEFEFPEKDESMGEVLISWIGPKFDNNIAYEALDMLGHYFTENANSLFNKHLVEIENPLATETYHSYDNYWNTCVSFMFSGVPTPRLKELDEKVKELIKGQTVAENFDLNFMQQIIKQQKLNLIFASEKKPTHFHECAITNFLYNSVDNTDFKEWVDCTKAYDTLLGWEQSQWAELIQKYLIDNHSISVLGKPSSKLNKQMKLDNKKLKNGILEKYGPDGLKKLGKRLEDAKLKNDLPIPDDLITNFSKPDPSKIGFITTNSYKAGTNKLSIGYTVDDFSKQLETDEMESNPLFFHFDDFKSQFITINVIMSTKNVDKEYLRYLSIMEEIFNMAIKLPDGTYIPYEKVINLVNDDIISCEFDNGFEGQFLEFLHVKVKCEPQNYQKAIDWIYKIMTMNVIEKDRIKVIIEKIINNIPDMKRNGELMMYSKQFRTLFNENSTRKAQDSMYNEKFYTDLLQDINDGKFEHIKSDLESFKEQLFTVNNFKVFVSGGCRSLSNPVSSWKQFIDGFEQQKEEIPLESLPSSHEFRSEIGLQCLGKAFGVSISAIESSNLTTLTKVPIEYLNDDIFKIALASEFLNGVEGPFWRGVRGNGLAYGTFLSRNLETGYLSYTIYSSTDVEEAWTTSKRIVNDFSNGTTKFDKMGIENSISAIMNGIANNESNLFDASMVRIADIVFRRRGDNYKQYLVDQLKTITAEDLVYIMNKYFTKLFDVESSVVFASIPTDKSGSVEGFFKEAGYEVQMEEINVEAGDESEDDGSEESGSESSGSESDSESESESDD